MPGAGGSALVLLCLLISGYLFNLIFYPLRYFSTRAEGQKLFFMAAGAGLVLGAFVFAMTAAVRGLPAFEGSFAASAASWIDQAVPVPHACRLLLTISVAISGAFLLNGLLWLRYGRKGRPTAKRVYNKLTDQFGNPLSQLLRRAADKQKLVLLTLKSRKMYCGRILEVPPNIEDDDACVEVLPSFSAYRDKDTLRMGREKTDYPAIAFWEATQYRYSLEAVLQFFDEQASRLGGISADAVAQERQRITAEIDNARAVLSDFGELTAFDINEWIKVIPLKEIESVSFYDPDAYKAWFAGAQGEEGGTPMPAGDSPVPPELA